MKAIQIQVTGGRDVLQYVDLPTPQPTPGQVLIKVDSASVNFSDVLRRRGDPYPFPTPLPFIPGSEVAGTIAALGEGVTGLAVGMSVFASSGRADGGYAQYALANAVGVLPLPPGLTTDEAAGLVVAGTTATLLLTDVTQVQQGENVVIPAAVGGVGSYAVQIARILGAGAIIAAVSMPEKAKVALNLGATHTVDYTQATWPDQVLEQTSGRGADVVLEVTGGPVFEQSLRTLAPFGRIVVYGRSGGQRLLFSTESIDRVFYDPSPNQSIINFNLGLWFGLRPEAAGQALKRLTDWIAAGEIKAQVGHVFPLEQAQQAHQLLENRGAIGKIILKPWL